MDLSPILNPLNDAQRAAVTAPLGPVLVLSLIHISEPTRPY